MYSVPTSANNGTLWYRTDLFRKAGLDAPTTWTKFYEAADKLTDKDKNKFGYTIRGGAGSIAQALDAMYGQSGITTFWNGDKTTVNDPKNVAALEKYVGLYKKDTPSADVNNDFTKMVAQWDSGTIGMLSHNLGSYQDHVKALGTDKFRASRTPTQDDGTRVQVPTRSTGWACSSRARTRRPPGSSSSSPPRTSRTPSGTSRRARCRRTPTPRRTLDRRPSRPGWPPRR